MKFILTQYVILSTAVLLISCFGNTSSQSQQLSRTENKVLVGGPCDGCELMFAGMPKSINATDTSAGWLEKGQQLLVTGTVFELDGKTPAADVVIYYWQTDHDGYYSPRPGMDARARRHGHIRGWVKTGKDGRYAIYTIRPAPYPNDNIPAHIHTSIKEPDIDNEYYIDEFVFDDDKLLSTKKRKEMENRGGSGVLRLLTSGQMQIAEHDIILGLNVPNYPTKLSSAVSSGLNIGEDNPSFIPFHAWGPDKGTRTCPVCKYGRYHGIVYFVGNRPDWDDIKKWLTFLESESNKRSKYLKAYFVYGNEKGYDADKRRKELEQIGQQLGLNRIALTYVPSLEDDESEVSLNKINPEAENTFIIYRYRTIVDKYINLKANPDNFKRLADVLEKTKGSYFDLPEVSH